MTRETMRGQDRADISVVIDPGLPNGAANGSSSGEQWEQTEHPGEEPAWNARSMRASRAIGGLRLGRHWAGSKSLCHGSPITPALSSLEPRFSATFARGVLGFGSAQRSRSLTRAFA